MEIVSRVENGQAIVEPGRGAAGRIAGADRRLPGDGAERLRFFTCKTENG